MSDTLSSQHPAVVLRSHYRHLKAMLAVAMVAVIGLAVALVIVASNSDGGSARAAAPQTYNGGHDEGHAGPFAPSVVSNKRYDGGPEEGTAGR